MTLRIVVGAAGLIGNAILGQLTSQPGHTVAVDPQLDPTPDGVEPWHFDAAGHQFPDRLQRTLVGHNRVEMYYAAGAATPLRRIANTTPDDFDVALNQLKRAYVVASRFAETVRTAGVTAAVVLIGSVGARRAHRYLIGYAAAKAGLESMSRGMALEYGPRGVTFRVLAVGPIAESPSTSADGDLLPGLVRLVPLGRYPHLEEIAQMAIALGSPAFDCANGHILAADGGLSVQLRPSDIERQPIH